VGKFNADSEILYKLKLQNVPAKKVTPDKKLCFSSFVIVNESSWTSNFFWVKVFGNLFNGSKSE
jgi:hypothetical protein